MSSNDNYVVVVDVHDESDDYCMSIFNRFNALFTDEVNFSGYQGDADLFPLLEAWAPIDKLEIVGHGDPLGCSIFTSCDFDVIGPELQKVLSDSGIVILTGCNTGCDSGNLCIGRDLAIVTGRTVLGTKGYVHGGTYYENNNRCSTDNDGMDTPFGNSAAAKKRRVYRKFLPSDNDPVVPEICP